MKYLLLLLILLTSTLFGDYNWTEPKLISTGRFNQTPFITADHNGTLHAFWAKADTLPGNHGCIIYAFSSDEGNSWSTPVNISNNSTDRPIAPHAVADSNNNLHLFYRNLYNYEAWYIKYLNGGWSTPTKLDFYPGVDINSLINHNGRIYLFWGCGDGRFGFSYLENQTWTPAKLVSDSLGCGGWVIGKANDIHIAGATVGDITPRKAYYYKYDHQSNSFTGFTDISKNRFITFGAAIAESNDSVLHIPIGFNNNSVPITTDYAFKSNHQIESWTFEDNVCQDISGVGRQILADSNDRPYIFLLNAGQKDTLYLFSKQDSAWLKEKVASAPIQISDYKAIISNNNIYLVYALTDAGSFIYFQKKKLPVGIANDSPSIINNFEMSVYPNPFNATTNVVLSITQTCDVKLEIFNVKGELVKSLLTGNFQSARYSFSFSAAGLNSGVYYCRLTTGRTTQTTRLLLLK